MRELPCTATGAVDYYFPPGERRDEAMLLLRLGLRFRLQQVGKRPGTLSLLVLDCARRAGPPYSFDQLLDELENEAARRNLCGEQASHVECVNRVWQLATIHLPKQGRVQKTFAVLRWHLTNAKKILKDEI